MCPKFTETILYHTMLDLLDFQKFQICKEHAVTAALIRLKHETKLNN